MLDAALQFIHSYNNFKDFVDVDTGGKDIPKMQLTTVGM